MSFKSPSFALIGLTGLMLSGCAAGSGSSLGLGKADNWGEANRQTFAAMVINPNPEYDDPIPKTSGDRVAAAIERLRTDKVKKPERQNVSEVGRTGGTGSSTGGGN